MTEIDNPKPEELEKTFLVLPNIAPIDRTSTEHNQQKLDSIYKLINDYEQELSEERATFYDNSTGKHYLKFIYDDVEEILQFEDDAEVALLTYTQERMLINPKLIGGINSVDGIWEFSKTIKDFDAMHKRLEIDTTHALVLKSFMEQILRVDNISRDYGQLLKDEINDLIAKNERIEANYRSEIDDLVPKFKEDLEEEGLLKINGTNRSRKKIIPTAGIALAMTGLIACGSMLSGADESTETLQTLTTETAPTSNNYTTTTLLENKDCGEFVIVEKDENLTEIAGKCKKTVEQIVLWNEIDNINLISEGQVLRLTEPEVVIETSTTLPETTTIPEITTTEITAVTIATTVAPPPESASPPLPPPETAPPTTQIPRETFLSAKECADLGGTLVPVPDDGRGTWKFFKDLGLTEYQVGTIYNSDIPAKFHLLQITAGEKPIECKPDASVIQAVAPLASPPTTT